jgi:hypothetical protein
VAPEGRRFQRGDAFKRMLHSLRSRREEEIAQLEAAIEKARVAGLDAAVVDELSAVRDRWREPLERADGRQNASST